MRYFIDFDKTINQLVPYFMGGRKLILYLQALMSPLRALNDEFVAWAKEMRIEAAMTSQAFKLEWYLNRKFRKYFAEPSGYISLRNSEPIGTAIYHQDANVEQTDNLVFGREEETEDVQTTILYRSDELNTSNYVSFVVSTPSINTELITEAKYIAMLKSVIERYRLANKTYIIKYETA